MDMDTALRQATHRADGNSEDLFKIGVHGLVFRFNGEEWMKSTVSVNDLVAFKQRKTAYVAPTIIY
jgi:hypothetical protein